MYRDDTQIGRYFQEIADHMLNAVRAEKFGLYLEKDNLRYTDVGCEKEFGDLFRKNAFRVAELALSLMTLPSVPLNKACEAQALSFEEEAEFLQELVNERRKMAQALRKVCK